MKKFATVLTAIVMLFATSSFAMDGDNVTAQVKAAFENDFSKAKQVSWEKKSDFYFASFLLNDVSVDAAYNDAGELLGTSRNIDASQIPMTISLELAQKYKGYTLSTHVLELNFDGQTSYYLNAENNDQLVSLKCSGNGDISVERKAKKS